MTPTTTLRAVLKIHMASDARFTALLPCTPSEHHQELDISEQVMTYWCKCERALISYSQLVDVKVSFIDWFSTMQDTLEML